MAIAYHELLQPFVCTQAGAKDAIRGKVFLQSSCGTEEEITREAKNIKHFAKVASLELKQRLKQESELFRHGISCV